jgi:hypothetical protein
VKLFNVFGLGITAFNLGTEISKCAYTETFNGWNGLWIAFCIVFTVWFGHDVLKD